MNNKARTSLYLFIFFVLLTGYLFYQAETYGDIGAFISAMTSGGLAILSLIFFIFAKRSLTTQTSVSSAPFAWKFVVVAYIFQSLVGALAIQFGGTEGLVQSLKVLTPLSLPLVFLSYLVYSQILVFVIQIMWLYVLGVVLHKLVLKNKKLAWAICAVYILIVLGAVGYAIQQYSKIVQVYENNNSAQIRETVENYKNAIGNLPVWKQDELKSFRDGGNYVLRYPGEWNVDTNGMFTNIFSPDKKIMIRIAFGGRSGDVYPEMITEHDSAIYSQNNPNANAVFHEKKYVENCACTVYVYSMSNPTLSNQAYWVPALIFMKDEGKIDNSYSILLSDPRYVQVPFEQLTTNSELWKLVPDVLQNFKFK